MSTVSQITMGVTPFDLRDADAQEKLTQLKSDLTLFLDEIKNTVQTYTFTNGQVSQILHKSGNDTVRTDAFTYTANSITETRTLASGATLTIVTNLATLETSVAYTAV